MARYHNEVVRTYDEPAAVDRAGFGVERLIYWLADIIEFLLLLRVLFSLFGVNTTNALVRFVYNTTAPFVAPFYGILNRSFHAGTARIETEALLAMLFVAVIAWALGRLIRIFRTS